MKTYTGKIVSAKSPNTAIVEIVFQQKHPLYKKISLKTKRLMAHYKDMEVKEGDTAVINETRPISKNKHFIITKVHKNTH